MEMNGKLFIKLGDLISEFKHLNLHKEEKYKDLFSEILCLYQDCFNKIKEKL